MPFLTGSGTIVYVPYKRKFIRDTWVKVFRIIPEIRILRLTFHRKSATKS